MAPARPLKRQKTNDNPNSGQPEALKPEQIPLPADSHVKTPSTVSEASTRIQDPKRSSWYPSWSRKTAPIATTSRDSVTSLHDANAETASILNDKSTPRRPSTRSTSLAMTLGKGNSSRSLPVDAMTSKVHATSDAQSPSRTNSVQTESDKGKEVAGKDAAKSENSQKTAAAAGEAASGDKRQDTSDVNNSSRQSGWFGWLAKEETPSGNQSKDAAKESGLLTASKDDSSSQPQTTTAEPAKAANQSTDQRTDVESGAGSSDTVSTASQKRSWYQMLGGDGAKNTDVAPRPTNSEPSPSQPTEGKKSVEVPIPKTPAKSESQVSSIETSPPPPLPGDSTKSAGWVFWSREKKSAQAPSTSDQPHEGEIAISNTPSQNRPKRASISLPEQERPPVKDMKAMPAKKIDKAGSIKSVERPPTPVDPKSTKTDPKGAKKIESKNATATAVEPPAPRPASPAPSKRAVDNLLLPEFHDTLHVHQSPTLLQQLSRLLYYTKEPELKHLSLVKDPPRIINALAIGVHGFFPGPMVRTLLGQPTGTSIKFADMAAKSIRKWTNSRGYDCQVKTAALEGEGKISERVELLWKLLLNWIDEIRKTDFVMVACHSQGVPVAVMLVAKLIQFGCVNAARVGICSMAGVSLGPFAEYKSRFISGSAGELFEFSDPNSSVSSMYQEAVDTVLKAGVRWTLTGSIDDQLVSLESSIFAPITHPHIYRAVHIDPRIHAPGFLSHLVGFVLKLRNLGVQDHGLIRELSSPLAGSLYTGEGHSRIYEDESVYDMAVSFALETTALLGVDVVRRNVQSTGGNPYILPFALRGILEEDLVRSELREEVNQLLQQFDDWRPATKALKDVKFRLEGVRSKL